MHTIIETSTYLDDVAKLGLSNDERDAIVRFFAMTPDAGDLIQGTGGARKTRVAGRSHGKRGGYRVISFYAAEDVPVFLLLIYGKDTKDNLRAAEKKEIKEYLEGLADDYRKSVRKLVVVRRR